MESQHSQKMITNLKKAVNEMLILSFLQLRPMSIDEISKYLDEKSHSICKIVYPYGAINRLLDANYILEEKKKKSPDDRRRQYYKITKKGTRYLVELRDGYEKFVQVIINIFQFIDCEEIFK